MANNIFQIKRTTVSGRQPNTTGSYSTNSQYIAAGEFALNMTDGILYSSNGSALIEIGANNTNQNVSNTLTVKTISANGSNGSAGQVLTSDGSITYWATAAATSGTVSVPVRQLYTTDGSVNTFTVTGGYTANNLDVYLNGIKLQNGVEANVKNGSTFTIITGNPANGTVIEVVGSQSYNSNSVVAKTGDTMTGALIVGNTSTNVIINTSAITISNGQIIQKYLGANSGAAIILSGNNTVGGAGYFDFLRANNTTAGANSVTLRLDSTGSLQVINGPYTSALWTLTQTGAMIMNGASSTNNDATTNYISFNSQNSVIYDDGNFHIHSRTSGQSMWINTNGGDLRLLSQSPVNGGSTGTSIIMGGSASSTASGYVNILNSKNMTYSGYGYLNSGGAGSISGSSGSVGVGLYCPNRIYSGEVDSTSDERLKDIKGTIPLDQALQFVKGIDGIHYTWKEGFGDDGLKAGFGAQSVHKAGFAHMVSGIPNDKVEGKTDDDGWVHPDKEQLNINYSEAIPYHHQVIKNLLERIDQLEQKVLELSNK